MSYWVMPPPENRPTEYGRPMLMTYSVTQEHYLSQDALNEMVRK
jgi:MPN domain-containing protein